MAGASSVSRRFSKAHVGLLFLLMVALLGSTVMAELNRPNAQDRQITLAVASLLKRGHLTRHEIDDEMSKRCLTTFLKTLDPMKIYFYQSDIDRFNKSATVLDDQIKRGNINFAYDVFNTFLKRVDERVAEVDKLLDMKHDFTVDEEMITDRDAVHYPRDAAEAFDRWRKRVKYDLLVQKTERVEEQQEATDKPRLIESEKDERQKAIEKLHRRYHSFAHRMHQTDRDELLEMYLTSLTSSYDPHTNYMSPSTLENFEIQMRLQLDGIGAALQSVDGYTIVSKIIPGGAADKDGRLKPKDQITGVGQGTDGEIVDVVDMKLSEVVALIRGKRRTIVRLKVKPADDETPQIYDITRAKIELKDSEARARVFEEGQKPDGKPYKIGVIDLPSFYMDMSAARLRLPNYKSTTRDVRKILDRFNRDGVDAVIMDLRRNGGGSLTESINLTGLFIDEGPVVQVKDADGEVQHYDDLDRGTAWNGPLVVLVSKLSASASEIFAGAIQDYHRGLIVGDQTTHGKGTVQTLRELGRELFIGPNPPQLGALKITMQKFYRPSGDSTQNRGVVSDIELPSLTEHLDIGESDLDYAMKFDRVDPTPYKADHDVVPQVVHQLTMLSRQRQQASEDFQKVQQRVARYLERKNRKTITLNEEKFMAQRAALDSNKDDEKQLQKLVDPNNSGIKRDYYMNEALAITLDYMRLMSVAQAN